MMQDLRDAWGYLLGPADFARAVARLGTRYVKPNSEPGAAELPLRWDSWVLDLARQGGPGPFKPAEALTFAAEWKDIASEHSAIRLELNGVHPYEIADAVRLLAAPEVGAVGIYCRDDVPAGEVRWNWPLRVGFLENAQSRALHRAIAKLLKSGTSSWRSDYIKLISPGQLDASGCHLLLLPGDATHSVAALSTARTVVRAACAIVLGELDDQSAAGSLATSVRQLSRAEGIAEVGVPIASLRTTYGVHFKAAHDWTFENLWAAWFVELVRELSHDRSLDVALFGLWNELGRPKLPPRVIASRRLIRESRIRNRVVRLGRQLQDPTVCHFQAPPPRRANPWVKIGPDGEVASFGELGKRFIDSPESLIFASESGTGSDMLELLEDYRSARSETRVRAPRWIQARVFTPPEPSTEPRFTAPPSSQKTVVVFQRGAVHPVEVFVGPREEDAVSPPVDAPPLPEDSLPEDRGVILTVVLSEAISDREPQVRRVFLPRNGRSEICRFAIHVPENVDRVEARIIVLFRNRVLQTSILSGPALGPGEDQTSEIVIAPETLLREELDDLESRSDFDASIVLNHANGTPAATAVHDGVAVRFPLPQAIADAARWFDDRMEEVSDNADEFTELSNEANLDLLRRMAQQGSLLWQAFDELISDAIDMSCYDRLQVVSTSGSTRLPIEFFYELPAPQNDAQLCAGAEEALLTGKPCKVCAKRKPEDDAWVCPLGFWGLTRVLERHMHAKGEQEERNELRAVGPIGARRSLSALGRYLFAFSNRVDAVDPRSSDRIRIALEGACGASPLKVEDWDAWARLVGEQASHLLFIVPHVVDGDQAELEIGADSRLKAALIKYQHVRQPRDREPAPVVVLLGCKTGKSKTPFADLPGVFRRQGAAVVLCTGAPILGRHAVRVAETLLEGLKNAMDGGKPISLGDVVRGLRRKMVLDGLPMVLTLLAFGDFDWQIAPATSVGTTALPPAASLTEGDSLANA